MVEPTPQYFVMVCEGKYPVRPIGTGPVEGGWRMGERITQPISQPVVFTLHPDYPGHLKAMYQEKAVPVMRNDLVRALTQAGVQNIQYFDAVIRDPHSSQEYADYKAFNIVGAVACADLVKSKLMGTADFRMGDTDFDSLVIDESRAQASGLLLFRLREKLSAIVVHQRVKKAVESGRFEGFIFYGPGDWSG